jgi:hypothetical protein
LLIHSPNWLFVYPGIVLTLLGLIGGGALIGGPVMLGSVALDVNTMLYFATAFIIGLQMLSLGCFTKIFHHRLYTPQKPLPVLTSFTLEKGLIIGGLLIFSGVIGSLISVSEWQSVQFGDLDPRAILRQVIPSATAIMAGGLLVVNSFTMGGIESLTDLDVDN